MTSAGGTASRATIWPGGRASGISASARSRGALDRAGRRFRLQQHRRPGLRRRARPIRSTSTSRSTSPAGPKRAGVRPVLRHPGRLRLRLRLRAQQLPRPLPLLRSRARRPRPLFHRPGRALAEVTRRFTWLTGRPVATPDWALGYSGSTMGYADAPDARRPSSRASWTTCARHDIPCAPFHLSSGYTSIGAAALRVPLEPRKVPRPERRVRGQLRGGGGAG